MTNKKNPYEVWGAFSDMYPTYNIGDGGDGDDTEFTVEMMKPKEIVEELDKTVIGQTTAKQLVAIAAWNRLLSMNNKILGRDSEEYYFEKSNILLIGNTGSGKTHMIKSLSKILSLPVTIQDATTFTSAGYVGRNIDECIEDLVNKAEDVFNIKYKDEFVSIADKEKIIRSIAEYGIVYIDEADKIRVSAGNGKDVGGRAVQEAFLKLVEGTEVHVRSKFFNGTIDTSNMLFIFGGAFADINQIVEKRLSSHGMGFTSQLKDPTKQEFNILSNICVRDLTQFGMIPELLGRLPTLAILDPVDKDMIYRIFSEPKHSILEQITNEFKSYDLEIRFTDCAIRHVVDKTMELKLGARGLRATCQKLLRPLMFHAPSSNLTKPIIITEKLLIKLAERGI